MLGHAIKSACAWKIYADIGGKRYLSICDKKRRVKGILVELRDQEMRCKRHGTNLIRIKYGIRDLERYIEKNCARGNLFE